MHNSKCQVSLPCANICVEPEEAHARQPHRPRRPRRLLRLHPAHVHAHAPVHALDGAEARTAQAAQRLRAPAPAPTMRKEPAQWPSVNEEG